MEMKVLAINGSPRKEGNTAALIKHVLAAVEKEGIETESISLAGKKLHGCIACFKCAENKDGQCAIKDDMNGLIEKMLEADAIVLGSPTYFANVSSEMKAVIDRAGLVSRVNGDLLKRKVGAAVVAVRRAGSVTTFDAINHFFLIGQMIVPGSIYWNMGIGMNKGDVEGDEEGVLTMTTLGENIAWLLKALHG